MAITLDGTAGINTSGTLVATGSLTTSSSLTTGTGAVYNGIQASTAVASTSGTSIDFTSVPSWVERITVMLNGVSTNGTSTVQIQIGTGSTTYTTTGYVSKFSSSSLTTGFGIVGNTAAVTRTGALVITNISGNTWVMQGNVDDASTAFSHIGSIALSAALTAVRITTVNGTDTFDAGSINILYE